MINDLLDKQFRAADGGNYGIQVLGILNEDTMVVVNIMWNTGKTMWSTPRLYNINYFKASYRYDLKNPRIPNQQDC